MLSSLRLSKYRAFESLEIADLGRVNLFVGKNNCGKTTILEAAEMLLAGTDPASITLSADRRSEVLATKGQKRIGREFEVYHLFHGHKLEMKSSFEIEGIEDSNTVSVCCKILPPEVQVNLFSKDSKDSEEYELESKFAISIESSLCEEPTLIPLSSICGISKYAIRRLSMQNKTETNPVTFIRTEALDNFVLSELWDSIALTNEESKVIETLRILEPNIDRIAFLSERYSGSGGIVVKLKDLDERIPLGSLGDGIRHLLSMSLAVSRTAGGSVMIDEIDTGLHHSVMTEMWRVLIETAKRLEVQVFATTHSQDCVRSLAWLNEKSPELCKDVRLHRVDKDRDKTMVYTPDEIQVAAKQHVELRG